MKIYLDNCCYNRPYGDKTYLNVSLETQAKLQVQEEIRTGKHELVWSSIEDYENAQNPFDYSKWRTNLFDGMTVEELAQKANAYSKSLN